ncbi:histidine kinase [Duganella sp. CY15W]|uniref:sensor histidine kinase n=1 Tax=Duganella sp. CY15W TaxID=2692172 RepID=UPI00136BB6CF|nr:histidine kinase [Duganella sp. CY15W]
MIADSSRANATRTGGDAVGASMVFVMRLVLALTAILTLFVAPGELGNRYGERTLLSSLIFGAYLLHSLTLLLAARRHRNPFWHGKAVYWIDLGWYALMVYCTGGGNSFFFPFFFFVILTASFQWGFDEGARITLGATLALAFATWLSDSNINEGHLLLRTAFVLALGYMIAYWGGTGVAQRRRLRLLRDVSRLSNPRFGVDQTIATMLIQTRDFYHASNCVLLMRDGPDELWQLHSSGAPDGRTSLSRLPEGAAAPLLVFAPQALVQYAAALHPRLPGSLESRQRAPDATRWQPLPPEQVEQLIDLLDASSFVSAPLPLRKGEGRIYVVSDQHRFSRADAVFLQQLAAQVFPVIENIVLLDRLASDAAFRERQKIARDLHDTTIQPYIGLRHGISAVRQSLQADHPVSAELDKLLDMTTQVIGDMRQFARNVRQGAATTDAELLVALRRQAQQVQEFYDIQITIQAEDGLTISDRLAAEVFQIVNEGMHNIRKHTRARTGLISLSNADGQLRIRIENESPEGPSAPFLPGSLAERTAALGGTIAIDCSASGYTAVSIAIPV